jgi:hypothetical protein
LARHFALGLLLTCTTAACTDRAEEAEKEYEIVRTSGAATAEEICSRGKAVADAYLKEGNSEKYREKRLTTRVECRLAEQDEAGH